MDLHVNNSLDRKPLLVWNLIKMFNKTIAMQNFKSFQTTYEMDGFFRFILHTMWCVRVHLKFQKHAQLPIEVYCFWIIEIVPLLNLQPYHIAYPKWQWWLIF